MNSSRRLHASSPLHSTIDKFPRVAEAHLYSTSRNSFTDWKGKSYGLKQSLKNQSEFGITLGGHCDHVSLAVYS